MRARLRLSLPALLALLLGLAPAGCDRGAAASADAPPRAPRSSLSQRENTEARPYLGTKAKIVKKSRKPGARKSSKKGKSSKRADKKAAKRGKKAGKSARKKTERPSPPRDFCDAPLAEVEARIDALLAEMTLAEKVEQMHGSEGPAWSTADNERLAIPGFRMLDGPRGVSKLAGNATAFPVGMARGASWDPELEERIGAAIGTETRAKGASVLLAPVTTVVRHPRWGRAQETYGEDPLHVGRMGVAFIRGAQRHVIASAKHYALNSIENTRFTVNVRVDERSLREIYLPHFRMAVQEGAVASVMTAYNRVNGEYCAENDRLLRILKEEWGFQGFVESDWILGTRSTVGSALAGLDIEMPRPVFYGSALVDAVRAGEVPESTIDEAVRRILRVKLCFRLDESPPQPAPEQVESPAHRALALEAARKSIVLLRNRNGRLPLDHGAPGSLVVIGELADRANLGDTGSSDVTPSAAVTPWAGIRDRAAPRPVLLLPRNTLGASERAAVADARAAIVVVGLTGAEEGESVVGAGDREALGLPPEQVQLLREVARLNAATIVVLEGGSAIQVEDWIEEVDALLMAWYPGQEGGTAIADVIFGDANPSAKLPLVFPRAESDLPPFPRDPEEIDYGYYHGYRRLDRDGAEARFPFGFGLSYTAFDYAKLKLSKKKLGPTDTLRLRFDLRNTGEVAGAEIVQLYVGSEGSAVDRPLRELKAFLRVELEAGEERRVQLELPMAELAYYDPTRGWTVERIRYRAEIGSSSRHLPLSADFEIR